MRHLKNKYYQIKNYLFLRISKYAPIISIIILLLLAVFFHFFAVDFQQNELNNLEVEILGVVFILIIVEYFILRVSRKCSYPYTKECVFSDVTKVLTNISLDILHNYLKIHTKELKDINISLIPGKEYLSKGANLLRLYCDENLRDLVEQKYVSLSDEVVHIWKQQIQEYRFNLEGFLKNAILINAKDDDVAHIYIINKKLYEIELELSKTKDIRERNKKFLSSYIYKLSDILIATMNSGLYSHWVIPTNMASVMKRSQ